MIRRDRLFPTTHLDDREDDAERLANVERVREVPAEYGKMPPLFGGGVDDGPGSRTGAAMAAAFDDSRVKAGDGVGFTIPSREPNKRFDVLRVSHGAPLRPVRAGVPRSEASDHLLGVADLAWTEAADVSTAVEARARVAWALR